MVGCACRVKIADDKGSGLFISPPLGLVSSRGLRAAIALSREGLARVRIRVKLRMTKGVVFFFPLRTAIRSGLTYINLAQYVFTCSTRPYTMHGWLCLPCGIADDKASCLVPWYCFDHYE